MILIPGGALAFSHCSAVACLVAARDDDDDGQYAHEQVSKMGGGVYF